jgi:type I pantothenate kinase
VDADPSHIEKWYVDRFLALRKGAFSNPSSYFNVFAHLTDDEAVATALGYWRDINMPNLLENVMPTRHRATLVLNKGIDHSVESVLLRKL